MSAISFTWTMSPNCEASSSTCLWRLVFIVPPRMNTTLLGPKLVIEGRDCRDNLRDGGDTFLGKPIGGNQTYPKTKQNQLNWDQPWFKPGSLACPPTPAHRLTINQVAHCAARFKLILILLLQSLLLSCEENYLWTIVTMSTGSSLHMSGLWERSISSQNFVL